MTKTNQWARRLQNRMPVLQQIVQRVSKDQPLRNKVVLMIQHQMEDELAQVQYLFDLGLQPDDLHWIDIPYTARARINNEIVQMGVPAENLWQHDFNPLGHYENYQLPRVRRWIDSRWEPACGSRDLIVLDDGGYFLRAFAQEPVNMPVSVVEQTLRGVKVVRQDPAALDCVNNRVPLVNVGESRAKKSIESPAIARSVMAGLENDFLELQARPWQKNWLIVGWGSIGSEIGRLLRGRVPLEKLWVRDIDEVRLEAASRDGYSIARAGEPREFSVVIGATGKRNLDSDLSDFLSDESYLASVSSSSIEFCRDELLANHSEYELCNVAEVDTLHAHLELKTARGQRFHLLNGGFPVNFDQGVIDRIPAEQIQFTAALMVHGAAQAACTDRPGFHNIDQGVQDLMFRFVRDRGSENDERR